MSWQIRTEASADGKLADDLEAAYLEQHTRGEHAGRDDQFDALLEAAVRLADSGVAGRAPFDVTIGGYATADGEQSTSNQASMSVRGVHQPKDA